MKKISLLAVFALCTFWALAQTEPTTPVAPTTPPPPPPAPVTQAPAPTSQNTSAVRLGLEVSPLISWFQTSGSGGKLETDGTRTNIRYGLNVDFKVSGNGNYYISTGLFMANLGGTLQYNRVDEQSVAFRRTTDFRANYLTIPFNVMLRTNEIGYVNYFFRVGFDSGFNVQATKDYEDVAVLTGASTKVDDESATSDFTLYRASLHLEVGMEYGISGNTRLYGSLEFNNGLNNVMDQDFRADVLDANDDDVKAQLSYFALNIGVYF